MRIGIRVQSLVGTDRIRLKAIKIGQAFNDLPCRVDLRLMQHPADNRALLLARFVPVRRAVACERLTLPGHTMMSANARTEVISQETSMAQDVCRLLPPAFPVFRGPSRQRRMSTESKTRSRHARRLSTPMLDTEGWLGRHSPTCEPSLPCPPASDPPSLANWGDWSRSGHRVNSTASSGELVERGSRDHGAG